MHVHTRTCEPWALAVFFFSAFWLGAPVGLDLSLTFSTLLVIMADAQAGRRRRVAQAEEGEHVRSARARMSDAEGRLDTVEMTLGRHETRLQFIEAPLRVVLRGFSSVGEFLRVLRENDMRRVKTAFIPSFCDELREKCGPEVQHLIEEAENLLVDQQGWVVGVYPTGGMMEDKPDGLLRLQPGFAGQRLSHVLVQASRYLADTHQLFQGDRGVCDPAQFLGIMMVAVFVSFPRGAPHPPESTLAVSPVLESILGVWLFFVCNITT